MTVNGVRLDWATIIGEGAAIVRSYSTRVTLRQLHYRLVAANVGGYQNTLGCYKQLSSRTAELRRAGAFPTLADNGRSVDRPAFDDNTADALSTMAANYRLDRTKGQEYQVWLLFEKATLQAQFWEWTSPYGIPIAALRGYSSETLEREATSAMARDDRPVVVFYVGDLDPEGEDIERNFEEQANRVGAYFHHWERLAVTPEQVDELGLVPNPGKETSSRAAGFIAKYGDLFQIETEAVDPGVLESFITEAVTGDEWFNADTYDALLARENRERERLEEFLEQWEDDEEPDDEDEF
jgi:hypothetical protein